MTTSIERLEPVMLVHARDLNSQQIEAGGSPVTATARCTAEAGSKSNK